VRYYPAGFLFDGKGMAVVSDDLWLLVGLLNSTACQHFANILMPTLNYKCGSVKKIPFVEPESAQRVRDVAQSAVGLAKESWDSSETSWDFQLPQLQINRCPVLCGSMEVTHIQASNRITRLLDLEKENNCLF